MEIKEQYITLYMQHQWITNVNVNVKNIYSREFESEAPAAEEMLD